jgi:hypothetical protein
MSEDSTLTYDKWSVNANDLPAKAIAYLLHNGFTQSMTDAAAFTKEQKAGKTEQQVKDMATEARDKRFQAILAGSVGIRVGGPRLDPVSRASNDIVDERLAAICKARNVAMPKGDVLKSARAKIMAKFGAEIKSEAEARVAKTQESVAELEGLFDEPETEGQAAA